MDTASLILGIRKVQEDKILGVFQAVGNKQEHFFDITLLRVMENFLPDDYGFRWGNRIS